MTQIALRLAQVRARIAAAARASDRPPEDIRLLAVSKVHPAARVREAFEAGQACFGENYVQEALRKQQALADLGIEWHFIGRIQSNKTRTIAEHFSWVQGLADLKHAQRLSHQRPAGLEPLNLCIQVNVSEETSKGGVVEKELPALAEAVGALPGLRLRGLMALPAPTSDVEAQHRAFRRVRQAYESLRERGLDLDTLSMGMSADLEAAIAEGATLVRVGTAIFGPRVRTGDDLQGR